MKPNITSVVGIAAVAGLAVWVAFEHQTRAGLRLEQQRLEQQLGDMAQLIASNEQLSNRLAQAPSPPSLTDDQSRELLRLRGQLGVLRQQGRELETAREENRLARAALESNLKSRTAAAPKAAATADYWPQDSWVFKGYASADATLQSSLWAANNGDLKALLASTTGEMQKMMAEDFKGKSEAEASIRAMDEVSGMKSVRVVNREVQSDDTRVLTLEIEGRTDTQTQKLMLKKIGNEWKLSGPAP
jgi:hypothetical protein